MTTSTISTLEKSIHQTNGWLDELGRELGCDAQQAYRALRAVLHALRDRMTVEEASDLGAQLPTIVRGFYYEGFNPSKQPTTESDRKEFLQRVSRELQDAQGVDALAATKAVFRLVATHCTLGQIRHVVTQLPQEVQELWPD